VTFVSWHLFTALEISLKCLEIPVWPKLANLESSRMFLFVPVSGTWNDSDKLTIWGLIRHLNQIEPIRDLALWKHTQTLIWELRRKRLGLDCQRSKKSLSSYSLLFRWEHSPAYWVKEAANWPLPSSTATSRRWWTSSRTSMKDIYLKSNLCKTMCLNAHSLF